MRGPLRSHPLFASLFNPGSGFLVLLALAGCVEHKMILRSDPPGAKAYVDDEFVGVTPCAAPFTHYGTRRVELAFDRDAFLKANGGATPEGYRDGFRQVVADAPLTVPWWQYPALDMFTEIVIPFTIHDRQEFTYRLEPLPPPPDLRTPEGQERAARRRDEVLERADALRERLRQQNEQEKKEPPKEGAP